MIERAGGASKDSRAELTFASLSAGQQTSLLRAPGPGNRVGRRQ